MGLQSLALPRDDPRRLVPLPRPVLASRINFYINPIDYGSLSSGPYYREIKWKALTCIDLPIDPYTV